MATAITEKRGKVPPGPSSSNFLGVMPEYQKDPLAFYLKAQREYGELVRFRAMPGFYWYMASSPDSVEHILSRRQQNYRKPDFFLKSVGTLAGDGLLTSEGDVWMRQRRLAQPAFHRQRLAELCSVMAAAANEIADQWAERADSGEAFNVADEMIRLTLKIVGLALFGMDLSGGADAIGKAVKEVLAQINEWMSGPLMIPLWVPLPQHRRFMETRRQLDELVYRVIRERRESGGDMGDLLSMLLQARDEETGAVMSDKHLRDEVFTLILAGFETTASALAWTWLLVGQHPDAEAKLHEEVDRVLGDRLAGFDDLASLEYTRMVFEESLRLYPPAWGVPRQAIEEDQIGEYRIPAGSVFAVSQWATHRNPKYWDNPDQFDPERFTPERSAGRPRFAYFPFGAGARQCIGNNFAIMETQLVIASIARRYRLELVPGQDFSPDPTFALKPRHGVMVKAVKR